MGTTLTIMNESDHEPLPSCRRQRRKADRHDRQDETIKPRRQCPRQTTALTRAMLLSLLAILSTSSSQIGASAQFTFSSPTPTIKSSPPSDSTASATTLAPTTSPAKIPTSPPTPTPIPIIVPVGPTTGPTPEPSNFPTQSSMPTANPSYSPTFYPTISPQPSYSPTTSLSPTSPPSTSPPSPSPTPQPSLSPVIPPTASPSTNITLSIKRECNQILEVQEPQEFNEVEVGIYMLQMQSYTELIGELVGVPFVVTTCTVTEQNLAGGRKLLGLLNGDESESESGNESDYNNDEGNHSENDRGLVQAYITDPIIQWTNTNTNNLPNLRGLQTTTSKILLVMQFTIQYESRYGIDVEEYPSLFQEYINNNLETVTEDMKTRFLPVVEAREVIVYNTKEPSVSPTPGGSKAPSNGVPTVNPTSPGETKSPTNGPSLSPITADMSKAPTSPPSLSPEMGVPLVPTTSPTPAKEIVEDKTSFVVGIAAGLSGAALVVILFLFYIKRKQKKDAAGVEMAIANGEEGRRRNELHAPRSSDGGGGGGGSSGGGVEMTADEAMLVVDGGTNNGNNGDVYNNYDDSAEYPPPEDDQGANGPMDQQQNPRDTIADSIFSSPSMVSGGGSFSSNEDENNPGIPLDAIQDEFDNYKNQDLEFMRSGVEESVYGAEGMMSLAMTRALMEDEEADIDLSWGGAEDAEAIEANSLCETNDWLRKNEHSTVDERNQYFQEILNRMVATVRRGMIRPVDGTRAIHCCAAMLGLRLEKDLPNNVLIVTGMRKTNNLSEGRFYLMEAFKSFGDIEGAAIAPSNRGFGFVRFIHPRSVQRAMQSFRVSEIEVQDVSVMIKSLKSDGPGI